MPALAVSRCCDCSCYSRIYTTHLLCLHLSSAQFLVILLCHLPPIHPLSSRPSLLPLPTPYKTKTTNNPSSSSFPRSIRPPSPALPCSPLLFPAIPSYSPVTPLPLPPSRYVSSTPSPLPPRPTPLADGPVRHRSTCPCPPQFNTL